MRLYVRPASPNWYVEWTDTAGMLQRKSTGVAHKRRGSQREAQEAADKLREEHAAELVVRSSMSLREAIHSFLDTAETNRVAGDKSLAPGTQKLYATRLATFVAWAEGKGVTALGQVNKELVADYARDRNKIVRSARQELVPLASLFTFTAEEGYPGSPPNDMVRSISKKGLRTPALVERNISERDARKVLDHIRMNERPFWYRFVALILETAMRHSEALHLRWDWIELDLMTKSGKITLPSTETKERKSRVAHFGSHLYEILIGIPRAPGSPVVFPSSMPNSNKDGVMGKVNAGWVAVRERAGFPKLRIHDLRHTWNAMTRDSGLEEVDRMAVSGHSKKATSRHYGAGGVEGLGERVRQHSPLAKLTGSTYKNAASAQEEITTPGNRETPSEDQEQ